MSSTSGRTFVDTNVLVYAVDNAFPAKRDTARRLLRETDPRELVVSSQVLAEFYVVTTRKLPQPMSPHAAAHAVRELSQLLVVAVDAQLVWSATELSGQAQISLWDALIVEAASLGGCDRIATEDLSHGATLRGLRIEDPFR